MVRGRLVALREKRLEDAANDYQWRTDPELSKLDATTPLKLPFSDFLFFYQDELAYPIPRRQRFAIDTTDNRHIGNAMLYDIDQRRGEAELGIMIGDKEYWSQGYGTEAVKLLLTVAFENLKLRKVYLHTLEWNLRAQRSFAKAGFQPVARVYTDGHDFLRMEITAQRWHELRKSAAAPATDTKAQDLG
jgi:RimJ/RimL family protein N-acetyltransferase